MSGDAVLSLSRVSKSYVDGATRHDVLRDVTLEVARGTFGAIVGRSGSGKSSLLAVAGALDRRYEGRIEVAGRDLAQLDDAGLSRLRCEQVGFVFQSFNLLPQLSAAQNVLLAGAFGDGPQRSDEEAREALDAVGLADKSHRRPGELSGGERQRVAIARALLMRPALLLADEPTGNLDARTAAQIIDLLKRLHEDHQLTLLVVTHEDRVSDAADRVWSIVDGRLEETS
jgi:putative ABC transport system ATP-binding protein